MARYVLLFLVLLFGSFTAMAQSSTGSLEGKITDQANKQPLMFANVSLYKAGSDIPETGTETDLDGNYSISNLDPGNYDLVVSYVGYSSQKITGVTIYLGKIVRKNVALLEGVTTDVVEIVYVEPLISVDKTTQGRTIGSEEIANLPSKSISGIVSTTAGATASDDGTINIRGSRGNATIVYVDGVRYNSSNIPQTEVEQLEVMTGGIGAAYGDVTAGVISITTKGPSEKFTGNFELENSNFLDPYGYLLGYASFSGPIIKKFDEKYGADKSVLGYRVGVQYRQRGDRSPAAGGVYKLKDDVHADLMANPVIPSDDGSLGIPKQYLLGDDDVELSKVQPNNADRRLDINGKLDLRINPSMDMSFGGGGLYNENNQASGAKIDAPTARPRTLANYHNNPVNEQLQYRGFARFRHRIDSDTSSIIQNLSYTIQASYERRQDWRMNEVHQENFFDYGYVGEFDWEDNFVLNYSADPTALVLDPATGDSIRPAQWDNVRSIVGFTPGTQNPGLAAYNEGFSNYPSSIEDLTPGQTGERGDGFYAYNGRQITDSGIDNNGIFSLINDPYDNYRKRDFNQVQFNITGNFEITPKSSEQGRHSIEFGLLYEQRVNRSWSLNPGELWLRGRQLLNRQHPGREVFTGEYITNDLGELLPVYDREPLDNQITDGESQQSYFDEQVRNKFGYTRMDFIHLDEIAPGDLTLDLFSPADLVNDMINDIDYYGYDAYGTPLDGTTTFSDFWTETDASGNRMFPVAPDQPIYTAAYIQDKFSYKDIIFRVGLRVDRYDANTQVLRDRYSFFGVTTVGEYKAQNGDAVIPDNISDDYVIYGDNSNIDDVTRITAFRNGDDWFNSEGVFQNNIVTGLGAENVQMILPSDVTETDVTSQEYNFESAFRDAVPQVSVMPRLAFSFPINENAGFFAHYDVLTQRAPSNTRTSALDYYRIQNTIQSSFRNLNNPELRPEKTIDYEVGFQQLLTKKTAMKVSLYYKELRDLIQSQFYSFAAPGEYFGFGNQDFGTVKGLSLEYNMRRTGNLRLTTNYTLQFANGTSSSADAQRSTVRLIGNLRTTNPLSFDERHRLTVSLDYRYSSGRTYNGPEIQGKQILANTGLNVLMIAASGRPYTVAQGINGPYSTVGFDGSFNGARLPWNTRIDVRLDRNIKLRDAVTEGDNKKDALFVNVYFRVQNLLDARNQTDVYRFSQSPYDTGYLTSQRGISDLDQIADADGQNAYISAYQWSLVNPGFFTFPRRMYIGAIFNF